MQWQEEHAFKNNTFNKALEEDEAQFLDAVHVYYTMYYAILLLLLLLLLLHYTLLYSTLHYTTLIYTALLHTPLVCCTLH